MKTASENYGDAPVDLGEIRFPAFQELMHYLYLPVRLPAHELGLDAPDGSLQWPRIPDRLKFLEPAVWKAFENAYHTTWGEHRLNDPYIYLSARRGFASPGNPLNRPGWHTDDFGGHDLNYVWSDAYPTRFLLSDDPLEISTDDHESMHQMETHAKYACHHPHRHVWEDCSLRIEDGKPNHMYRIDPLVIHDTPLIPAPGGMRSFFKISVSAHRYNLVGNSHNHLFDYDWPMVEREVLRNQPVGGNKDYADPALVLA